ncbi:MAG: hypothetical protein ACKVT1_07625 [Dehalococcoidia bacterium]
MDEISGLEFDARNLEHLARHGVDATLVWDVFLGDPKFFEQVQNELRSGTHLMVGPSTTGKHWTIVIVRVDDAAGTWRPITGWPSTGREIRRWREDD